MKRPLLNSLALSELFESIALMLSSGMQASQALWTLAQDSGDEDVLSTCRQMCTSLDNGNPLGEAAQQTGAFPPYAVKMLKIGDKSGRSEEVARSLATYYGEEHRLFSRLRSSLGYPCLLLGLMSVILVVTCALVLPVFMNVYQQMTGSLTTGSYWFVSLALVVGWAAFALTLAATVAMLALYVKSGSESGRMALLRLCEKVPSLKESAYNLAVSRFSAALATALASGLNTSEALALATQTVDHRQLSQRLSDAQVAMDDNSDPKGLARAMVEAGLFQPLYGHMLLVQATAGSTAEALDALSATLFEDALDSMTAAIDKIEPLLAGLLTVAVGATLLTVMMPLIGIMGSIG